MVAHFDHQIAAVEQQLRRRKAAVKFQSCKVMKTTRRNLATPTALCVAFGSGFAVGEMTTPPKQRNTAGEVEQGPSPLVKVLRVIASVQTATTIAKYF
ncbi:MAG TPA: hypothetical protein VFM61_10710 [Pseudidiomarina sp.]|nr:hypothetical protein [Pseudidiomarina sp.]